MTLEEEYVVHPVASKRAEAFVCTHHYSRKMPSSSHVFGLIRREDHTLFGACVFRVGTTKGLHVGVPWPVLELARLCLERSEKNLASFFIARCLSELERGQLLVSYADAKWSHCGYIYQATNWLYAGKTSEKLAFEKKGHVFHQKTISDTFGTMSVEAMRERGYSPITLPQKHRYFYPLSRSKKQKKEMVKWVTEKFGLFPYPKQDPKPYDMKTIENGEQKSGFGL
jgi:hypothetical protein